MLAATLCVACSAAPGEDAPPLKDKEPTSNAELATTSSTGDAPEIVGDLCMSAPALTGTVHEGTLFGTGADLAIDGDTCRMDGADAFVRFRVTGRADVTVTAQGHGFAPTVALVGPSCTEAFACTVGVPATALDVAADTELVIAVGIAADDPALASAAAPEDLGFSLRIETRAVLAIGESCGLPGQGRCASGTACLPNEDDANVCTLVAGDTCASATPIPIELGSGATTVTVDPSVPYDDAHHHTCAGARRRDHVLLVQWPSPGATLAVTTTTADVALAVRAPGCIASDEIACDSPAKSGASIEAHVAGSSAFVFVELPADDPAAPPPPPFDVDLTLLP
jgi:hypothetical protein